MRALTTSLFLVLSALLLSACGGADLRVSDGDMFSNANYRYYSWRSEALPRDSGSRDLIYRVDPVVRKEMDAVLASKGYIYDAGKAQFSVDYIYAPGLADGAYPSQASNISHLPTANPNRQIDQASVDNAIALGGVKETDNIVLQFNDVQSQSIIWRASLSKVVEDANRAKANQLETRLSSEIRRALASLPVAAISP